MVTGQTSSVHRAAVGASSSDASAYGHDLANWPRSWMGLDQDLPPGEHLLACFRPFIAHLASSRLSPKTIRTHVDNLWILGGEIIRDLHDEPALRRRTADRVLRDVVHADGGPLMYNSSENAQRSLDSTCRKLHRFLNQPQR